MSIYVDLEELCAAGLYVTRLVVEQVIRDVSREPDICLDEITIGRPHANPKKGLRVDVNAEDTFSRELYGYRRGKFRNVKIFGEERLRDARLNLTGRPGIVALVDAVDGTDLVARGLGKRYQFNRMHNWKLRYILYILPKPSRDHAIAINILICYVYWQYVPSSHLSEDRL